MKIACKGPCAMATISEHDHISVRGQFLSPQLTKPHTFHIRCFRGRRSCRSDITASSSQQLSANRDALATANTCPSTSELLCNGSKAQGPLTRYGIVLGPSHATSPAAAWAQEVALGLTGKSSQTSGRNASSKRQGLSLQAQWKSDLFESG